MKSCDEWVKHILEERDKQLALRKKRRKAVICYSSLAACLCVTILLGSQVLKSIETIRKDNLVKSPASSSVSDIPVNTTEKSSETTVKINAPVTEISGNDKKSLVTTALQNEFTEKPEETTVYEKNTHVNTVPAVAAKPEHKTSLINKQTTAPVAASSDIRTKKTTRPPVQTVPDVMTEKTTLKTDNGIITETAIITEESAPITSTEFAIISINTIMPETQPLETVIVIVSKPAANKF